jgi:hypothetical protein
VSQLQQLKQQINAIGNDAKSTSQGLGGFKSKFSTAVSQVAATIGGSSQRVDQNMINTLQAAEKQVDAAIQALHAAASAATSYAASL